MKRDNFIDAFEESVKSNWDSIAIKEYPGESITYSSLGNAINELQEEWISMGIGPNAKIGICANNSIYWLVVYFAAVSNGNTAVLFPTSFSSEKIIECLQHSDCEILYTEDQFSSILTERCVGNKCKILIIKNICLSSSTIPQATNDHTNGVDVIDDEHICTILYTSGSTGTPRGVMLSVRSISNNLQCYFDYPFAKDEIYHLNTTLPYFHIFGLINDAILPLCFGKELIISQLPNTPNNIIEIIHTYRPTYFFTLPLIVENLINHIITTKVIGGSNHFCIEVYENDKESVNKLRYIVMEVLGENFKAFYTGGTALSQNLKKILKAIELPLISGYGLSECGNLTIGTFSNKENSCGRVYSRNLMRIDSEDSINIPGEVQVKGNSMFSGYYKDNESTKKAFTDDGWFRTGDVGVIDNDGILTITGRMKSVLITSNGENIYPGEIEEAMNTSPYIIESILVQRGEKIQAIVVPDKEKAKADSLDAEALNKMIDITVREASKKLPGFTIISSFELRDEPLERTPKGSLKRYLYSDGIKEN